MTTKKAAKRAAGTAATNVKRGGLSQGVITLVIGVAIVVMGAEYVIKHGTALVFGLVLDVLGAFIVVMGIVQIVVVLSDRRRR